MLKKQMDMELDEFNKEVQANPEMLKTLETRILPLLQDLPTPIITDLPSWTILQVKSPSSNTIPPFFHSLSPSPHLSILHSPNTLWPVPCFLGASILCQISPSLQGPRSYSLWQESSAILYENPSSQSQNPSPFLFKNSLCLSGHTP